MRKIVLGVGLSLDGYIARSNGAVDFLFSPKDYSIAAFVATIDTYIMGRKTLDAALKMTGGRFTGTGGLPAYVFSRTQPPGERDGLTFVNESPAAFVKRILSSRGKDIWHMGGGELAREFSRQIWSMNSISELFPYCWEKVSRCFPAAFLNATFRWSRTRPIPKA
jgi:dihydrofolate reductase